jgi:soluble epoxide hydrolase/lipid-phosphate phosphatase
MLSTTARLYTKRFSQLIFLAVGYNPSQAPLQDIDAINAAVSPIVGWPIFGYWKFHNRPDAASILEAADVS